jgi:hydroxypyruvate reductase
LILSDVIGDPMDVIASGPTVPDPTTIADAIGVLRTHGVWDAVAPAIQEHLLRGDDESPKPGDVCFATVTSTVIGNNTKAANAACDYALSLGYDASLMTTTLMGEAREQGRMIAEHALDVQSAMEPGAAPRCLVYAGETTVTVTGAGTGGRNQELVLAAALTLDGSRGITITSIGTDGIDGPTNAAGAVADGETVARARHAGDDPEQALANNDAYTFWKPLDTLVMTGPTGTNVMDLIVVTITSLTK